MDGMPVANDGHDQQQKCNQQNAGRFRRADRAPVLPGITVVVARFRHANIVAPPGRTALAGQPAENVPHDRPGKPSAKLRPSAMPVPPNIRRIVRFGTFELDLAAGELSRNGSRLKLQEQPFQVLAALVARPGEVVTREELRQKLWPSDTFVDFDHSLNTAINKVREALGDSASTPRYVETLARRGYRFIAPLQADVSSERYNEVESSKPSEGEVLHPDLAVPLPRRALTRGLFALIQVMYLIFYVSALLRLHAVQSLADSFLPFWAATTLAGAVMVTAGVGIPLRFYLISAAGFDHQRLGEKFRQIFPGILALDQLWAVAPFLLIPQIGLGAAFAACAALLYVPFSERSLIRMAYWKG
jgi:cholera toxin transcriptional activator